MTSHLLVELEALAAPRTQQYPEPCATPTALRPLVDRVSMWAPGATTVLYGGQLIALNTAHNAASAGAARHGNGHGHRRWHVMAALMVLCGGSANWAWAQSVGATGATPALSNAAPAATANPEPAYRACPSGYYLGPRPLRAWYTKDDYHWVVTPAFAAAFCMPPEFISTELSGAQAIAYKPVFEAVQRCVFKDAKESCTRRMLHALEIYYKTSLQLPATSDTRYNHVGNTTLPSSMHLLAQQAKPSVPASQAWQASRPGAQHKFAGWQWLSAQGTQPLASIAPLREVQYIDERLINHHFLALETNAGQLFNASWDKPGSGRLVLVLDKPGHPRDGLAKDLRTGYGHVIELPQSLVAVIRAVDKEGEGVFKARLRPAKTDQPPGPAAQSH